jgi:phospholipid/cholesterol/gamma-HCH transport system permease protein
MLGPIGKTQEWFIEACGGAGYTLQLLLRGVLYIRSAPRKIGEIIAQTHSAVFGSMTVVFIVALFTGMTLALQTGIELARYQGQENIGTIVSAAMCREMGPVMTAYAFAGLIGAAMAAHLATMKVQEEVDALVAMSIDPVYFLVMPRIVALAIALPLMTIYADAIGILGGAVVAQSILGVDLGIYFNKAQDAVDLKDIYGGLFKAFVFGITIAALACAQGLRAEHGAAGVGRATLRSVILSFIFVLVFNYFLTWALYRI